MTELRPYSLRDLERFVPWRHGAGFYEAPCRCLYHPFYGNWCAICPKIHGRCSVSGDIYALQYVARYLVAEKDPEKEFVVRPDGRKVVREGTLWSRISDYGLRDYGMLSMYLTPEQYLDVLYAVDAHKARVEALAQAPRPAYSRGSYNPRYDQEKAVLDMAEAILLGHRQPPKRGVPSSKSGRPRVVGPCRHAVLDASEPPYCFKCGQVLGASDPSGILTYRSDL